jgi:ubiquinone/menaquinone biosynthesis C-methylase UbiE
MHGADWHDLFRYYEDRAPEYDDIYMGKGPDIRHPEIYSKDVAAITTICGRHGHGHLVDIGCGTGFWLPHYAHNCEEITLIDQSQRMLARCQARIAELDRPIKVNYIKGDFFQLRFLTEAFDSALVAFLVSHLNEEQERIFFRKMKELLKPRAKILWIDGAWSEVRSQSREKEGVQLRKLKNGRDYRIFKRYFTDEDAVSSLNTYGMDVVTIYMGSVFFAVQAELRF